MNVCLPIETSELVQFFARLKSGVLDLLQMLSSYKLARLHCENVTSYTSFTDYTISQSRQQSFFQSPLKIDASFKTETFPDNTIQIFTENPTNFQIPFKSQNFSEHVRFLLSYGELYRSCCACASFCRQHP
jgi:hypothetical protein